MSWEYSIVHYGKCMLVLVIKNLWVKSALTLLALPINKRYNTVFIVR